MNEFHDPRSPTDFRLGGCRIGIRGRPNPHSTDLWNENGLNVIAQCDAPFRPSSSIVPIRFWHGPELPVPGDTTPGGHSRPISDAGRRGRVVLNEAVNEVLERI